MSRDGIEAVSRRRALQILPPLAFGTLAGCRGFGGSATDTATTGQRSATRRSPTDATSTETEESTVTEAPTASELVSRAAIPLETVDPTADLGDIEPLGSRLADATVVGMGEATHGTREFYEMKHRLVRYLVEQRDLRVVAMEANFPETMLVDEYVTGGDVDPEAALENIYLWTYNTASVLSLLRWLRSFNAGRDPEDKVRFYGLDAQNVKGAARRLRAYLADVDPDYLETIRSDLDRLADGGLYTDDFSVDQAAVDTTERLVAELGDRLESERERYVSASSASAWELAERFRWTMDRVLAKLAADEANDVAESLRVRDAAMAANVSWIREFEDADRIALWGHNDHVADKRFRRYEVPTMGRHLREAYGDDYYALGFDFGRGTVRAKTLRDPEMNVFEFGSPPAETLSATLAAVPNPVYALDLASVDDRLRDVLDAEYGIHSVGGAYDPSWPLEYRFPPVDLPAVFDGFVFVAESTATDVRKDKYVTATPSDTATSSTDAGPR